MAFVNMKYKNTEIELKFWIEDSMYITAAGNLSDIVTALQLLQKENPDGTRTFINFRVESIAKIGDDNA